MKVDIRDVFIVLGVLIAGFFLWRLGADVFGTAFGVLLLAVGLFTPGRGVKKNVENP